MLKRCYLSALVIGATLSGCAGQATTAQPATPRPSQSNATQTTPVAPADFAAWRTGFRARALAEGIKPAVFDGAFKGVTLNQQVMELDGRQAEFSRQIWDYLDTATSATRVSTGRQKWEQLKPALRAIEQRYGVDARVVLAIWGMETNYGSYRGNTSTIEGLATLAFEGRRRTFAEAQLMAALQILQAGDVSPEKMRGSWAGAMGHTQFMPTSYLEYAQDFTGDGKRDIWAEDPTDALASTAYYLSRFGWDHNAPWGVEVRLPAGFDYRLADQNQLQPVAYWRNQGITTIDGQSLPDHGEAAILVPAGARGPAFAIFNNFKVIRRYNNATSYAMAVGHLGDKLAGGGEFVAPWPRDEQALSRTEKEELQRRLTARGFDTKGADGVIGPNTINAIRAYQQSVGQIADGYASASLLKQLR
ncbi:lytic murein transglycosylase [Oceanisphaera psychrotolerans]|uniref:Murein transglycosylase n=1 Tax=Oceanisphaera psychrotolerans TaxID=1414654 RepID=A0A1J4QDZ4_9GAMM|nr:lytic murein transglycosylase [Oceanisphaera psychrotolerans]OIN06613.1 murein transglycosylase [Oceanisphaera psychrotolerans]